MKRRCRPAFLFAAAAVSAAFPPLFAGGAAAGTLEASIVSEFRRIGMDEASELSGIAHAGGGLFYSVDDANGKLYPLFFAIDPENGSAESSSAIAASGVRLEGADDAEGCAFDPFSGTVWVSDETGSRIREHDPFTGAALREAPVPDAFLPPNCRPDRSLEALSVSPDGMTMWTANEEALFSDGPVSGAQTGTVVRLARFARSSAFGEWTPDGQFAYRTQPMAQDGGAAQRRSGVSGTVALPDGRLLVLERELSGWTFRLRLFEADCSEATDVSRLSALEDAGFRPASKRLLCETETGTAFPIPCGECRNYEAVCLGPRLAGGDFALVLVSDGGGNGHVGKYAMTIRLRGVSAP